MTREINETKMLEMSSLINVSLNSRQMCSPSRTAWFYRSACTEAEDSGVKREEDNHFSFKKKNLHHIGCVRDSEF